MPEYHFEKEIQEIWRLFEEVTKKFQETDRQFKETVMQFKETDKKFQETAMQFQETDRKFLKTDESFKALEGVFIGQWGKLMEALVEPGVLKLFQERGIQVDESFERARRKRNGHEMEIDLVLPNETDVIAVEVKTTLKVEDVQDFLDKLGQFMDFFPKYKGHRIYGAVAALKIEEESDIFACKKGLFVLKVGKEGLIEMMNDDKFRPKTFGIKA
ncbi:MAG TPA: hypothetical protein VJL89_05680 [Thermodesulfovibrionia bacterium]|nr:hypothetical protein [Thermodesulfovibrionia bacterium]